MTIWFLLDLLRISVAIVSAFNASARGTDLAHASIVLVTIEIKEDRLAWEESIFEAIIHFVNELIDTACDLKLDRSQHRSLELLWKILWRAMASLRSLLSASKYVRLIRPVSSHWKIFCL